ncbi:hypothetical protein EV127DRAFT_180632 [Xylaria flabelliformis]|nr:hypothetical protein EV127DRAFT_180632 [Xylaria flabelliformis]
MSSWMNEAAAIPNHAGNGFPHMGDPNNMAGAGMMDPSAFMANAGQFNPSAAGQQFPNPQQMAVAMQNGQMRNASPAFANPVYQTNSVIPSKRPRPREDSIGASPRQNPGMLPTSRADTPQQSQFPGFQPNAMPQNAGQPQHYPHLQPNGSATASPSPVMAGNQLRPGSVPQRVNTASPHPFSPASQQFGQQASPVPSEHSNTPQPGMYMNPQSFPQGYNPGFAPSPSPARPPSAQNPMTPHMAPHQMGQMAQQMPQMHPNQMYANQQMQHMQQMQQMQHMQAAQAMQGRGGMDPKMMYHMRLQQQYSQGNMPPAGADMQAQNMAQNRGMMPKQGMPMQNGQMPPGGMRPQQAPQISRGINPEIFMKNLTVFMNARQLPLDMNPIVENRQLHLFQLFQVVQKFNGYRNVTTHNMWPQIAASIGFPPQQIPSAPGQLKGIYERNLVKFEEAWMNQQRSHQMKQQAASAAGMPTAQNQGTPQRMAQLSPSQNMQPMQPQMQVQNAQSPVKSMLPSMQQGTVNGFSAPQHPQIPQQPPNSNQGSLRNSMSRSVDTPVNTEFPIHSPGPATKADSVTPHHPSQQADIIKVNGTGALHLAGSLPTNNGVYTPFSRALASHPNQGSWGGFELDSIDQLGTELGRSKPDMPGVYDLGNIDLHALTKSIQSGIHAEVRLALDILATVSRYSDLLPLLVVDLRHCEDLVESLLDCAEDQIDILAENAEPISDEIDLTSYEDILRAARAEQFSLRKVPVFGDKDYELERAADRLIAITTILRNLSFPEQNQPVLADEVVIRFFCGLIRSLGTHEGLLRNSQNTLDIMKDIVVLLSNIAASVELPGRDQAFCLLQFILSFAPSPTPFTTADKLVFSPFEPSIHKYLPHALDALAKLLARDEPNRTYYKALVTTDALSSNPYELLTRTFALAVSPIPYNLDEIRPGILPQLVDARKPLLMQGLLAADIIAQLAPGYETGVTRAWLSSGDGFAPKLLKLVKTICQYVEFPMGRPGTNANGRHREDPDLLYIVTCAVSALRRLCEKAKDPSDAASIPPNALPTRVSLFESLNVLKNPKWALLLNQLSAYVGLEN